MLKLGLKVPDERGISDNGHVSRDDGGDVRPCFGKLALDSDFNLYFAYDVIRFGISSLTNN